MRPDAVINIHFLSTEQAGKTRVQLFPCAPQASGPKSGAVQEAEWAVLGKCVPCRLGHSSVLSNILHRAFWAEPPIILERKRPPANECAQKMKYCPLQTTKVTSVGRCPYQVFPDLQTQTDIGPALVQTSTEATEATSLLEA